MNCVKEVLLVVWLVLQLDRAFGGIGNNTGITATIPGNKLYSELTAILRTRKETLSSTSRTDVYLSLSLKHIISVNEQNQVISVHMRLSMSWVDPSLKWDPNNHSNLKQVFVPVEHAWLPGIFLYNLIAESYEPQVAHPYLMVNYTGGVSYSYPISTKALCHIDVEYFPFDQQTCSLVLSSWYLDERYLDLHLVHPGASTAEYKDNLEWELRSFVARKAMKKFSCCKDQFAILEFPITMRRRWYIYGAYLLLPNFIMSILCIFQFLLPCDSNERVGLGITLFLSLIVYLILIESILPATEKFPVFVAYIFVTLMEVFVSVIVSVLVLYLHYTATNGAKEMPEWVRKNIMDSLHNFTGMHQFMMTEVLKERLKAKRLEYTEKVKSGSNLRPSYNFGSKNISGNNANNKGEKSNHTIHSCTGIECSASRSKNLNACNATSNNVNSFDESENLRQRKGKGEPTKTDSKISRGTNHGANNMQDSSTDHVQDSSTDNVQDCSTATARSTNTSYLLRCIVDLCENYEDRVADEYRARIVRQQWQLLAMLIDRLMFILFSGLNMLVWISLLTTYSLYLSRREDYPDWYLKQGAGETIF